MRGSPLLRTLIVLAALLATGLALGKLTKSHAPVAPLPVKTEEPPAAKATKKATYELVLSGVAKEVAINDQPVVVSEAGPLAGRLEITGEQPVVALRVTWADQAAGHRFAKLRLEIPGKPTLEHVFDSSGDIDDIWEP
ncbi:hypothetical protein [Haloferula sp. BvORR071]|uniref:hypothetical protein n=1 Tax=Haloferula sp. BvORR071 TaxID=1396141 RepID=UPI002240F8A1|nr:hypothetical protein [Haloferula sp. BvORR071]